MSEQTMRQDELRCYRCGGSLAGLSLPLSRRDLCPHCSVELHVCRMCRHYAPEKAEACDEDDAAEVRDKQAANFCDYFKPGHDVFDGREQRDEHRARRQLDALFGAETGDTASPSDQAASEWGAAEDLFRK